MMQRIDEDEIHHLGARDIELRQHVEGNQARQPEGGGLIQVGDGGDGPSEYFLRLKELELAVEEAKVRFGEVNLGHITLTVGSGGITRVGPLQRGATAAAPTWGVCSCRHGCVDRGKRVQGDQRDWRDLGQICTEAGEETHLKRDGTDSTDGNT